MIYIPFERRYKFSNTIARVLVLRTIIQQRQLRTKWLRCNTRFLRVSEGNVRRIQDSFERSPRKSTRRASRELGITQPTVRRVLRRRLLFSRVHIFESPCIKKGKMIFHLFFQVILLLRHSYKCLPNR